MEENNVINTVCSNGTADFQNIVIDNFSDSYFDN